MLVSSTGDYSGSILYCSFDCAISSVLRFRWIVCSSTAQWIGNNNSISTSMPETMILHSAVHVHKENVC